MTDFKEALERYCKQVMESEAKPDTILLNHKQYERGEEAVRLKLNYTDFWTYVYTGQLPKNLSTNPPE